MLVLLIGVILIVYYLITLKIKPSRYPNVPEDAVYEYQRIRIKNGRRYAGLFLIYILLAIGNGVLYQHTSQPGHTSLWFSALFGIQIAYMVFAVIVVWRTVKSTAQHKHNLLGVKRIL